MSTFTRRLILAAFAAVAVAFAVTSLSGNGTLMSRLVFGGPANPAKPLAGKVIVVDAGHGGHDSGAQQTYAFCNLTAPAGVTKINEKDINLAIALKFRDQLEAKGAIVYMTRETDVFVDLWDRVAMSADISKTPKGQRDGVAKRSTDIFISIHVNSVDRVTNFDEIQVYSYFPPGKELNLKLSPVLQIELNKRTRAFHPKDFRVIDHNAKIPSVLVETGFITNADTCRDLVDSAYQDRFAAALVKGVDDYFNNTGAGAGTTVQQVNPMKKKSKDKSKPKKKGDLLFQDQDDLHFHDHNHYNHSERDH